MRKTSALMAGVLSGLASSGTVAETGRYPTLEGSDMSRMRGDVERVGGDFCTVIKRQHGKTKNSTTGRQADHKAA